MPVCTPVPGTGQEIFMEGMHERMNERMTDRGRRGKTSWCWVIREGFLE